MEVVCVLCRGGPPSTRWAQRGKVKNKSASDSLAINPRPLTVDLLEHAEHVLQVAVVQEPDGRVLVVLLKWNCK